MKKQKIWYKLDAFAKTYSSIISEGRTTCFRLSILLCEDINVDLLGKATLYMENKYPFYNSELKKGIFWNYLQQKRGHFTVEEEKTYPCTEIKKKNPLRILYYKNKISVEIAHFLTDGTGGMYFFKELIEKYMDLKYMKGEMCEPVEKIEPREEQRGIEYEDMYAKHMKKVNKERTIKRAFHLPLRVLEKGQYHITTGEIDTENLKKEAKKYDTTIGKYLLAVYFKVLLEKYSYARREIVIGVPVDLRKIFQEETYRNFFINITPGIDPGLGNHTLEEIIGYLDSYFKIKITRKEFYKSIYKAMNPMENMAIRVVPYIIKRIFFPFIFDYYGERGYTTGFSNLGILTLEEKYRKYIKGFRFLPPPSKRCKIKIGVISDNKRVYITFGNLTTDHEIEGDFFKYLRKRGIRSKIITNYTN